MNCCMSLCPRLNPLPDRLTITIIACVNSRERRAFNRELKRLGRESLSPTPAPLIDDRKSASRSLGARLWDKLARLSGWTWAVIGGVSILLSLLLPFLADVSFTPRTRLDPTDPFSTLFTVTNEGVFDIEDVRFACHMNDVEEIRYLVTVQNLDGATDPKWEPEIKPHKSQDVACLFGVAGVAMRPSPNGPPAEYRVADITLCASFRPSFWWRRKQSERFIGRTDGQGKIVEWSHQVGGRECDHY
jgi:hypothetical protein